MWHSDQFPAQPGEIGYPARLQNTGMAFNTGNRVFVDRIHKTY